MTRPNSSARSLQHTGAQGALHDFGAGAATFGYLKSLPENCLKTDGQFIRHLLTDPLKQAGVKCLVDVAHAVGIKTVAEHVETDAVLACLRNWASTLRRAISCTARNRQLPRARLQPALDDANGCACVNPFAQHQVPEPGISGGIGGGGGGDAHSGGGAGRYAAKRRKTPLASTLLAVHDALLFVTDPGGEQVHAQALDAALQRMAVTAARRQVVSLAEAPEMGAHWHVRVTPCLVLDTGSRQVQLAGDPAMLDPARLEQALSQR